MAHFTAEDWEGFVKGLINGDKRKSMEEHILTCDTCSDKYLSYFSQKEAEAASKGLHPQFVSRVMKDIDDFERQRAKIVRKGRNMAYYIAVACLTLFFVSVGVFDSFIYIVPEITKSMGSQGLSLPKTHESVIRFGWSEELMNSTLMFIDTVKPKDREVLD